MTSSLLERLQWSVAKARSSSWQDGAVSLKQPRSVSSPPPVPCPTALWANDGAEIPFNMASQEASPLAGPTGNLSTGSGGPDAVVLPEVETDIAKPANSAALSLSTGAAATSLHDEQVKGSNGQPPPTASQHTPPVTAKKPWDPAAHNAADGVVPSKVR